MADKRPWAKIDTAYVLNPKWFAIQRAMQDAYANADALALKRACMQMHFASILYCAQNQTDGLFPVSTIKALCDIRDHEEPAVTALFESGMWINHPGGMAEVRDFLEHQMPATKADEISKKRRDAARARWAKHATSNANSNATSNANSNAEKKRKEEKLIAESFAAWWAAYPRKDDRLKAEPAFSKALKKAEADELIKAAKEYAIEKQGVEKKFIKLPATWLNAGSWMNETTVAPPKRIVTAGEIPDDW